MFKLHCKELLWKIPYEKQSADKIYIRLKIKGKLTYKEEAIKFNPDNICDNQIILDETKDLNPLESGNIPIMFENLPEPNIGSGGYNFLLYGYKNTNDYNELSNSLQKTIKIYRWIKDDVFNYFDDTCIIDKGINNNSIIDKYKLSQANCGFNCAIFACILNQYLLHYTKFKPLDEDKKIMIDMALSYYKSIMPYEGNFSSIGYKCNGFTHNNFDKNGVYIVTLYDRKFRINKSCDVEHYFIVYVNNDFSILIDAWIGLGGSRKKFIRIMKTSDMKRVINYIDTETDLSNLNIVLNIFFFIPHGRNNKFDYIKTVYAVGTIYLGDNTSGYWYRHAGNRALPTKIWKIKNKYRDSKIKEANNLEDIHLENNTLKNNPLNNSSSHDFIQIMHNSNTSTFLNKPPKMKSTRKRRRANKFGEQKVNIINLNNNNTSKTSKTSNTSNTSNTNTYNINLGKRKTSNKINHNKLTNSNK